MRRRKEVKGTDSWSKGREINARCGDDMGWAVFLGGVAEARGEASGVFFL